MFSTNATNPKGYDESYRFNLGKYYRIWFSKNPDVFLGVENELRFIRLRHANPEVKIFFIYSAKALNQAALLAMQVFCEKHQITPIDFDTDIPALLEHHGDKDLYALAQLELSRALNDEDGNLASAADCVRLLLPVIERYGIYTDFDVECDLSRLGADVIQLQAPLLLNAEMKNFSNKLVLLNPNSDFIAFAFDAKHPQYMCSKALEALRYIQRDIINNYKKSIDVYTFFTKEDIRSGAVNSVVVTAFNQFSKEYKSNATIFDFRKFLKTFSIHGVPASSMSNIKKYLYNVSVICMSGPGTYNAMYRNLLPSSIGVFPVYAPATVESGWRLYLDLFRKSSIGFYDAVCDRIQSKNTMTNADSQNGPVDPGVFCDLSWTEEGVVFKSQREAAIVKATCVTQSMWRKGLDVHAAFLHLAKSFTTDKSLQAIEKHDYSLALRVSCAEHNLELVSLLLRWKDKVGVNINALSSNGNSPLDWAHGKTHKHTGKIVELLVLNGAMTGEAIKLDAARKGASSYTE